ncbi:MAG TPA: hypothetical protein VH857_10135 [Actinomycetes bacterium]|nr:hypothetical protein [Actinomycetes bacterium]
MTSYRPLSSTLIAGSIVLAATALALPSTAARADTGRTVVVTRGGPVQEFPLDPAAGGEGLLSFTASAPGADWGVKGRESGVAELLVDGQPRTDLVVPSSTRTQRSLGLGTLSPGRHIVTVRFDGGASPAGVDQVRLKDVQADVTPNPVLGHAPVVVGRALPALGSADQNATTDTPLLAWHESRPAATPGHTIVEYSVVWSNEDGGTDTPALMARWGRTTDIEWIYRVELDEHGQRVPGSDVYQAPNHATLPFTGQYEDGHPVLQTCTSNNNMCDQVTLPAGQQGLRFLLDSSDTRAADRARESLMDTHPWTYPVMAAEMAREGQVEQPGSPATPAMSDQRNYLFLEMRKSTGAATGTGSAPGVSIGVRLKGDPTLYRSDHSQPSWTVTRDDPAATTVELPAGTTVADIAQVVALRQPSGAGDNGAPVTFLGINRAFILGSDLLPGASFLNQDNDLTLTATVPQAVVWQAGS